MSEASEYENADMRAARDLGLCGALMSNAKRSGRCCERKANHLGKCASQYSKLGQAARLIAYQRARDNA